MSTRAKAAKTARRSTKRLQAPRSMCNDPADDAIVNALRLRADELRGHNDRPCQQAARIVEWAASAGGSALRDWMIAFKARQAAAPSWQKVTEQVPFGRDWSLQRFEDELVRAKAKWEAEVVLDGNGEPAQIDVVDYIDSLAYWVASRPLPSPWMRRGSIERGKYLAAVRTRALELAKLLEDQDGPGWPNAIELFDSAHRPFVCESSPLREYRARVADRLKGQTLSRVLLELAKRTDLQRRIDARDAEAVRRPNTRDHLTRELARRIRDWFEMRCRLKSGNELCLLIASLINASRSEAVRRDKGEVDADGVREWLRSPRKRTR